MRPILAFAILLLGLSSAAPEPDYSAYLIEISASRRQRRRAVADRNRTPRPAAPIGFPCPSPSTASPSRPNNAVRRPMHDSEARAGRRYRFRPAPTDMSLDDLCNALFSSALDNDLPVPFFANLIWQESRLRDDAVSRKGALGIAQFMPETAAETGLDNPFDPLKAIPASARFLRELRLEFGNLGFVAAAYNAGAHRVIEWLEHRASLPRETRGYVVRVTGLSVDAWRKHGGERRRADLRPAPALPQPARLRQRGTGASRASPSCSRPSSNSSRSTRPKPTSQAGASQAATSRRPKRSCTARHASTSAAAAIMSAATRTAPRTSGAPQSAKPNSIHTPAAKSTTASSRAHGRSLNPRQRTPSHA